LGHKPHFLPDQREDRPREPKKAPAISLSEPFPLLDPGQYVAVCTEATFAWARQWNKWIARLVLEPENYQGRPYAGRLCKFLGLGKNKERPYAGPQSHFRQLYVEVNGAQPPSLEAGIEIFVGVRYEIEVVTVKTDGSGNPRSSEHWYSVVKSIHPCKAGRTTPQPSNPLPSNPPTQGTRTTLTTDQHSNTENTPLAAEIRIAAEKVARAKAMRARTQ
jgi:hypothetical protein